MSTVSKLESDVDGLMRVVRSTEESVTVERIRTGAMVAIKLLMYAVIMQEADYENSILKAFVKRSTPSSS